MVRFNAHLEIGICGLLSYFISFCISCNKHEAVLSLFQFSAQRSGKTENDIISASRKCNSVAKGDQNISRRWCQTLPLQFKLELIAWPLFIYEVPHRSLQVILLGHYPSLQTTHALPVTSIFSLRGSQTLGQQQQVLFVGRNTTRPAKASESQKKTKTGRPRRRKGAGGRSGLCCGASVCSPVGSHTGVPVRLCADGARVGGVTSQQITRFSLQLGGTGRLTGLLRLTPKQSALHLYSAGSKSYPAAQQHKRCLSVLLHVTYCLA